MASYFEFDHSPDVSRSEAEQIARSVTDDNERIPSGQSLYYARDQSTPRPAGHPQHIYVMSADSNRYDSDVDRLEERAEQSYSGRVQTMFTDSGTPRYRDTTYRLRHNAHTASVVKRGNVHAFSAGPNGPKKHQLKSFANNAGY